MESTTLADITSENTQTTMTTTPVLNQTSLAITPIESSKIFTKMVQQKIVHPGSI